MKLEKIKNSFFINNKKKFSGKSIEKKDLENAFNFAFEMAFGKGYHRAIRSGGNEVRTPINIFRNTLQGKLAEIVVYNFFIKNKFICEKIDFSISEKGIWDDCDLIVNNKKISIKSAAYFSNLLLLETADWNSNGNYIPNITNKNSSNKYDYFIFVRIKPNTNSLFENGSEKEILRKEIYTQNWFFDIVGCCSLDTLIYVINKEYILPKNSLLNGKIKMDAENYYIQSGDLKNLNYLINEL
ncbi:hypothetical protein H9I45_15445 [Polaribacter haliotis]|uniref:Restriction endonuclease n=1 Tax=Polaribacter haliotis TaxID=1888915 RepID=A0A7L8AFC0_9FLAO|nr:hypothetical protein [Polaribacter haliotis]QOD60713.1 hypothetical protein H9I45_15445 [Polaribacter haliotis]